MNKNDPSSTSHPTPQENTFLGFTLNGFNKIHYVEWGDPASTKVIVCVHGMSRNGRDFDYLAQELVKIGYRVICPDLPGRGKSEWLTNPMDYNTPQHIQEILSLIARINVEKIDWVGTSMGGLIGMVLAAFPQSPIRKLIMNDIGPFIPAAPLQRIVQYLSFVPTFKDKKQVRKYLQQLLTPFGPLTHEHMDHLVKHAYFSTAGGELRLAYDPKILTNVKKEDVDLWNLWEKVEAPTLVLRGADSEVLTKDILNRMLKKKNVSMVEFENTAHAPALMSPEQIHEITTWLEETID